MDDWSISEGRTEIDEWPISEIVEMPISFIIGSEDVECLAEHAYDLAD